MLVGAKRAVKCGYISLACCFGLDYHAMVADAWGTYFQWFDIVNLRSTQFVNHEVHREIAMRVLKCECGPSPVIYLD